MKFQRNGKVRRRSHRYEGRLAMKREIQGSKVKCWLVPFRTNRRMIVESTIDFPMGTSISPVFLGERLSTATMRFNLNSSWSQDASFRSWAEKRWTSSIPRMELDVDWIQITLTGQPLLLTAGMIVAMRWFAWAVRSQLSVDGLEWHQWV